jgi:chromosome segregation ATPase
VRAEEERQAGAQRVALYMELGALREEASALSGELEEANAALRRSRLDVHGKQALLDAAESQGLAAAEQYGKLVLAHTQLQREALLLGEAKARLEAEVLEQGAELAEKTSKLVAAHKREVQGGALLTEREDVLASTREEVLTLTVALSQSEARVAELVTEVDDLRVQQETREARLAQVTQRADALEQQGAEVAADLAASRAAGAASGGGAAACASPARPRSRAGG